MYEQDANGVSHVSVGDVFEAKGGQTDVCGMWVVLSPKNMNSVTLNRHKLGQIPSYGGFSTTVRRGISRSFI